MELQLRTIKEWEDNTPRDITLVRVYLDHGLVTKAYATRISDGRVIRYNAAGEASLFSARMAAKRVPENDYRWKN